MMKVSIVILNYNGQKLLAQFLPSVLAFSLQPNVEIIVADNGSTDDSIPLLERYYSTIHLIKLDKNYGFAGGYNLALKQVKSDYFLLLNSDVQVTENWLSPLINQMEEHPEIAACQPKILSLAQPTKFEHAGACGGFIDKYGYPFCRGRVFTTLEQDNGQYDTITDIFWASGACLFIRSSLFFEMEGFDDTFFAHMEEIDLCWRLKNRGYRIICVPQSTIYHVGGGSLDTKNVRKTYLNFRNNWLMLYKNMTDKELRPIYFFRFFFDYIAAFQMIVTLQRGHAYHVWKARHDFKKMRPQYATQRLDNQKKKTITAPTGILNRSLVLAYHLFRKKRFDQLKDSIRLFINEKP
jgi:GT2 family glycosyltransferase